MLYRLCHFFKECIKFPHNVYCIIQSNLGLRKILGVGTTIYIIISRIIQRYGSRKLRMYFVEKRHNIIKNFLKKEVTITLPENVPSFRENIYSDTIWICWWQGEDNMPPIVKMCTRKIRENSNGHNVIFISQETYKKYVEVPEKFISDVKTGRMKIAHLADYVRYKLLFQYGGVWIDATMLVTRPIGTFGEFEYDFYSIHLQEPLDDNCIARCRWMTPLIFCKQGNELIYNVFTLLEKYFLNYEVCIDYLLVDYIFDFLVSQNSRFADYINRIPYNNELVYELNHLYYQSYDKDNFEKIINSNTHYFKLTYRTCAPQETVSGLTYYGYLLTLK